MIQRKELDNDLEALRELLREMGAHVKVALEEAVASLQHIDLEKARLVVERDVRLNRLEEQVMDVGSRLIVTQQPVAKDLRKIIAAFKISSDLERMGDLALDVAKVTIRLEGQKLVKPLVDIPRMADLVCQMIDDSLTSYLDENTDLAYKMAQTDDKVDQIYSHISTELFAIINNDPQKIHQAMQLTLVGRFIERIGDHATNIGESTVYLVTGKRPDLNQ